MAPRTVKRPILGLVALLPLLAACTDTGSEPPEPTDTPVTTSSALPTETPTTTSESRAETTESETSTTRTSTSTTRTTGRGSGLEIEEVAETFATLAPPSLFEQFDSCEPTGMDNSSACTGAEIGEFRFTESESQAESTTQQLTQLRSSRVLEHKGERIVGWTTLGTMVAVTVVDNENGMLLQHFISSNDVEPEDLIYELGLAEPPVDYSSDEKN